MNFNFFNLNYHVSQDIQSRFYGQNSESRYLNDDWIFNHWTTDVETIFLLQLIDTNFNNLLSLNNFLFAQHQDFLRRCPIKKSKSGETVFDVNCLSSEIGEPIQYSGEEEEQALEAIDEIFGDEINRWEQYAEIYQPGFAASSALIYIEKLLISTFKVLEDFEPSTKPRKRSTNMSIIDGKMDILRTEYSINFNLPSKLAKTFFAARTARNMFAHGDWENVVKPFAELTARDLIEGAQDFTKLLSEALSKRYA